MEKPIKLYAFRYFIIPFDQVSIDQLQFTDKNDIMRGIFSNLIEKKKLENTHRNKRYILYYSESLAKELILCKFAREKIITKYEEGEMDLEQVQDHDFPYIYIVVDLNRQIILLEYRSNFATIDDAKNVLCSWLNKLVEKYDFTLSLEEITYEKDFWKTVEDSDELYNLEMKMKSPNLFGGRIEAEELLKELNASYNNTESTIKLTNDKGRLRITSEKLQSYIKYIANGGGEWLLTLKSSGERRRKKIRSKSNIKTIELSADEDLKNPKIIIEEISKIDDIMTDIIYSKNSNRSKHEEE